MFRKINNKTLGFLFVVLLIVVTIFFVLDSGKSERTFREVLVDIDSSAVTEILIYPKKDHREVKLFKTDHGWKVNLPSGKSAKVTDQKISELFVQLNSIQPKRLAARDQSKWNEFQVDSTGSRVQVMEGSRLALDLVIGRFSFQQPRTMNTFVRLYKDTDVYEVDGFLDITFNQDANAFRDGTILKDDYNKWQQFKFNYPADSSFQLTKRSDGWLVNGVKADSSKTINYLRRIANFSNSNFVDDASIDQNTAPTYSIQISTSDLSFAEIKAYIDTSSYVIHSTQNPEAYFDGKTFANTIFVGKSSFLSR